MWLPWSSTTLALSGTTASLSLIWIPFDQLLIASGCNISTPLSSGRHTNFIAASKFVCMMHTGLPSHVNQRKQSTPVGLLGLLNGSHKWTYPTLCWDGWNHVVTIKQKWFTRFAILCTPLPYGTSWLLSVGRWWWLLASTCWPAVIKQTMSWPLGVKVAGSNPPIAAAPVLINDVNCHFFNKGSERLKNHIFI